MCERKWVYWQYLCVFFCIFPFSSWWQKGGKKERGKKKKSKTPQPGAGGGN
jgi:hypothetical protein